MNVISLMTMGYEKVDIWLFRKTKPIQTQPVVSLSNLFVAASCLIEAGSFIASAKKDSEDGSTKLVPKVQSRIKGKKMTVTGFKTVSKLPAMPIPRGNGLPTIAGEIIITNLY